MSDRFRLTLAQLNPTVGDIDGNAAKARAAWAEGKAAGADLVALNDYMASVPAEDWQAMTLVLASRMNGNTMPVYEKGPFWLVYPVDTLQKPLPQAYVARMV